MDIYLKDIPEYLKNSELYRIFLENSGDIITINPKHYVKDIVIQSFDQLCNYLEIYRYWMLDESSKNLFYDYIKNNITLDEKCILQLKDNFYELSDFIEEFEQIKIFNENSCVFAARKGNIYLLKYLYENGCPWCESTCEIAVFYGHHDCLKYAHENGCPWNENTCTYASLKGHYDCLRYAHENGCPWDEWTCMSAAMKGHLDCLRYAHENGCPWNIWTCNYAKSNNHLDCLRYALENGCST